MSADKQNALIALSAATAAMRAWPKGSVGWRKASAVRFEAQISALLEHGATKEEVAVASGLQNDPADAPARHVTQAEAERDQLRAWVAGIARHGTNFDTNPTINMADPLAAVEQLLNYIKRMDTEMRNRAKDLLEELGE